MSSPVPALLANALSRRCDPSEIPFETTNDAAPLEDIVGQERAIEAVRFGIAIRRDGYNLFALGPQGVGKQTVLRQFLDRQAARETTPEDWCYVANFDDMHRPRALRLPAGRGAPFRADVERAIADLRTAMRAAFGGEEHRMRRREIVARLKERQQRALAAIQARVRAQRVAVVETDDGIVIGPLRGDAVLGPDEFHALPEREQAAIRAAMERTGEELHALLHQFHDWVREHHAELEALDRETAAAVARRVLDGVRARFRDVAPVIEHLSRLELDVIEHAADFRENEEEGLPAALRRAFGHDEEAPPLRRYAVNVVVDHAGAHGAPVVREDNPTYSNLVGRIEHTQQLGALVTDFTLIRPGALHRARGGYLLLDAIEVLRQPYAWDALKRAMRAREIRTESLGQVLGLVSTQSLEPEPIPLEDTKIVLVGERILYYLLAALDPDFLEVFKVMVDFEETMDRGPDAHALYARLIATLVRKEQLRPADRSAVARVVEHAARLAGDAEKLSVRMRPIADLLREADHCAGVAGRPIVGAEDVQAALDAQDRRAGRLRERVLEAIRRENILIDVEREVVGQVNGLSCVELGEHRFGHPTRITARVRVGKGELVDIEREVELGGPIHSKGVLILAGFLGARYARRAPLSLAASLVFEQCYGGVEGDSASLAEICALLSALAELPIKQSLAVTGSVNQHGQVQPVGGVNEKIEGFFDACRERGATSVQGVLVPRGNVKNLMLRGDVVRAVEEGRFHVHTVGDVDETMALLTGRTAGARDADGRFPEGSVNALVEARLLALAEDARKFVLMPGAPR